MAQAIAKAKIVAIQEHKLTATRMEEIPSQLARRRLKWLGSPALVTEKGGVSSGVALVCQAALDVWIEGKSASIVPGRLSYAFVRCPELGVIAVYSIYLETGIGLRGAHVKTLEAWLAHVLGHKVPWIAVGDLNLDPGDLEQVEWVRRLKAQVLVPPSPTCHSSGGQHTTRDYMLLSIDLSDCFATPTISTDIVMATHDAVDFWVRPKSQWPDVQVLGPVTRLPAIKPAGPCRPRAQWNRVSQQPKEGISWRHPHR